MNNEIPKLEVSEISEVSCQLVRFKEYLAQARFGRPEKFSVTQHILGVRHKIDLDRINWKLDLEICQ